jgi:ketosteroid isomerase-like protein
MKHHETVKETTMQFLNAYASRDLAGCMQLIAEDKPLMLLGTNLEEVAKTREEVQQVLQRDFAAMSNIEWGTASHISIKAEDQLASVLIELPISYVANEKQEQTVLRYALALIKQNDSWRIAQAMASLPAPAGTYNFTSWE